MEVYLVRHTKPDIEKAICYGQADIGLAASYDEELKNLLPKIPKEIQYVYSSPLLRCKKLAEAISTKVIIDNRLMELNFGDWELKKWQDIPEAQSKAWMKNYFEIAPPNGESMNALIKRVKHFWNAVPKNKTVIVTHGGVIKTILGLIEGRPKDEWMSITIDYGAVIKMGEPNRD